jgi:hypothetical protein
MEDNGQLPMDINDTLLPLTVDQLIACTVFQVEEDKPSSASTSTETEATRAAKKGTRKRKEKG